MISYLYFERATGRGVAAGTAYSIAEIVADRPPGCDWIRTPGRVSPARHAVDPRRGLVEIAGPPAPPDYLSALRARRDELLRACDWVMGADGPRNRAAWRAYRRALRDLPETAGPVPPDLVQWPAPPPIIFGKDAQK